MNVDRVILNHVLEGLNKLESGEINHLSIEGNMPEHAVGELHSYLRQDYNIEVNKNTLNGSYAMKVSKMETH